MTDARLVTHVVDLVIAVTLIECVALVVFYRASGKGVAPRDYLVNMVSGLCLMLALRALASEAGAVWVAAFLLGAGLAHGIDIGMRWHRHAARDKAFDELETA